MLSFWVVEDRTEGGMKKKTRFQMRSKQKCMKKENAINDSSIDRYKNTSPLNETSEPLKGAKTVRLRINEGVKRAFTIVDASMKLQRLRAIWDKANSLLRRFNCGS